MGVPHIGQQPSSPPFVEGVQVGTVAFLDLVPADLERGGEHEIIEILNHWARFLYGPLMEDRTRRIQEAASSQYGRDVAEKVHTELKRVGGIAVPREFVFMDRAAIGLGSVFLHLRAELNWHRIFHELIDDFDEEKLGARQAKALEAAGLAGVE